MVALDFFINPRRLLFALSHVLPHILKGAAEIDGRASERMVEEMRAEVAVDSGRLLNGIRAYKDGDETVVEASAVRGDFDYAFMVEKGRVADAGYFAPEPFFYPNVEEVLEERGRSMDDLIDGAASAEGLS